MKEQFINRYTLSKTLQFALIPVGKTEENFEKKLLLEQDEKRAEEYEKIKGYIDRYHKSYIDSTLSSFDSDEFKKNVKQYAEIYYRKFEGGKKQNVEAIEKKLREKIAKALTSTDTYKKMFSENMIKEILPSYLTDEEEKKSVEMFNKFTTYFTGFNENRKIMYSDKDQVTAISHRCINDNLPKFLDNCASFQRVVKTLPADTLKQLDDDIQAHCDFHASDAFLVDYFSKFLSQSGIDRYNEILGGYTCEDGTKVKGLNEYINLYNQSVNSKDKSARLPFMKPLYKQILSDRESLSFLPEKFESDSDLLSSVNEFYMTSIKSTTEKLEKLFAEFGNFNLSGVFVSSGPAITELSNSVFKSWSAISSAWYAEYESAFPLKRGKNPEKYLEDEKKAYKAHKSFAISELQRLGASVADNSIAAYYTDGVAQEVTCVRQSYAVAENLLSSEYINSKKLCSNTEAIELIKNFLDSVKALEYLVKPLLGTGKEENKDEVFYGEFLPLFTELSTVDRLYDKVRNYLTQKPYSKDKIKLNFETANFLKGWAYKKERERSSFVLRDDKKYYLAVIDPDNKTVFSEFNTPCYETDSIQKMYYYQIADPVKDLPNLMVINGKTEMKKGRKSPEDGINHILEDLRNQYLPENINRIRLARSYSISSENFSRSDLKDYIDFYQKRVSEYFYQCHFSFKPSEQYSSFLEFTDHVDSQAYQVWFEDVSKKQIMSWVESGQLYLFQIYNKDFSEYSKGTPNLHTMYFKMLFDERNLKNVVYQLNGGAEMFYRKPSINDKEKIVHPANQPIANKNPENPKTESVFKYDLVKDKRFTKRQFSLHLPITLNFKAEGQNLANYDVRKLLKKSECPYIIGIDRGERNLLYVCVIDGNGNIVEQMSLNEIISDNGYKVDYHDLLDRKEKERDEARKSWGTIENIKELKEGYMSQVVHKICELVLKYDAVIAMEDLNSGFMNSRVKVEKQVYRKFEKMLTDKLNYLVDKKADPEVDGGLLRAYQLTNKADGKNKGRQDDRQDGIVFYIPAWNTSKIDPTTGFVDLLKPKYTSVKAAKDFFGLFDDIRYNCAENLFEFRFNYSHFPKGSAAGDTEWVVCTNGERIRTFRNPEKNNEWDNKTVILTEAFKSLFKEFSVDYSGNLKENILAQNSAKFHEELVHLLALTLQMRNSITGRTDVDYIISPVRNAGGDFYDSRKANPSLPVDADANGAYNIARKVLWAISVLKDTDEPELPNVNRCITNKEWLEYAMNQR